MYMATKKQSITTDSTAPENQQIPVPVAAKATKKAGTTKKTNTANTSDTAADTPTQAADAPIKAAAPAKKKAAAPKAEKPTESAALTKVYGQIQTSDGKFFIEKGSVPEGQLQLELPKNSGQLADRIPSYTGQFVTVLGEFAKKKKSDASATFVLRNITSHDEIGRRAFELSHENPADVEDNWFKAENELLQQK
jgi:hypothetical protein